MLRNFATGLHARMSANGVEAPSVAVIEYAMKIVTNAVSIAGLTLIIGLLTGELERTANMLIVFAAFRFITGGYHLKSGIFCVIVSTAALSLTPLVNLSDMMTNLCTAIACIVVAVFAPSNFDKYAWLSKRHYPKLKVLALVIVSSNFLIGSDILALTYILQAVLLPFKDGGDAK